MTLNSAIATASAAWFSEGITDAITYNGTPIRGHIEYAETGPDGVQALLEIQKADVPNPALDDVVVYSGQTFRVSSVGGRDGNVIKSGDSISWTVFLSRNVGGIY
jgi:hypothetical protein